MKRRVVITGMGVISPVGNDVETFWNNLLAGKSGISHIEGYDTTAYPTNGPATSPMTTSNEYGVFDCARIALPAARCSFQSVGPYTGQASKIPTRGTSRTSST